MTDGLSLECITQALGGDLAFYDIVVKDSVSSTNTLLKEYAAGQSSSVAARPEVGGLPFAGDGRMKVLIAGHQTAGRGRRGRSFESPAGTGVYLSVLLRPGCPAEQFLAITTAAAVAACLAIEECTEEKPQIKWVNDVYVRGKKVCGILTEGSADPASGLLNWAVMGIGFNVYEPQNGFSEGIKDLAGAITQNVQKNLRERLSGVFLRHFADVLAAGQHAEAYKSRSLLTGKDIVVIRSGAEKPAHVLDVDDQCRLVVRYEDGSTEALSSGEVSTRLLG